MKPKPIVIFLLDKMFLYIKMLFLFLSERIVEDFESSDSFLPLVASHKYFLRIEEDPSKYEFLRRPQLIFKKEFVETPKKIGANRRFEEAIEVKRFLSNKFRNQKWFDPISHSLVDVFKCIYRNFFSTNEEKPCSWNQVKFTSI